MTSGALAKIDAATAAEICVRFDLKAEAKALLGEGATPREFIEALVENRHYIAGIDFIAHALPAREAVWWGCLCLQHACGDSLTARDKAACGAAVRWVLAPGEETRALAQAPADAAGPGSPAGGLAMAVNQMGGSAALPNAPPMPPVPFAAAKAVAGAIKMASTKAEPAKIAEMQRLFVELGIGVTEGRFGWPEIRNSPSVWRYTG